MGGWEGGSTNFQLQIRDLLWVQSERRSNAVAAAAGRCTMCLERTQDAMHVSGISREEVGVPWLLSLRAGVEPQEPPEQQSLLSVVLLTPARFADPSLHSHTQT